MSLVSEHELVLGQEKVSEKSNEKTAIPELLKSLDLKDTVVSCAWRQACIWVRRGTINKCGSNCRKAGALLDGFEAKSKEHL